MLRSLVKRFVAVCVVGLFSVNSFVAQATESSSDKALLGERLFFDVNLSKNRTQSCATCHNPVTGFVDDRSHNSVGKAVSVGDDGKSLGDRNAPTAAYAQFTPLFQFKSNNRRYAGGHFHDGREKDLAGQAGGPPVNPVEMGMPNKAAVVARLQENADYVKLFKQLFGDKVFDQSDTAYAAMAESIGEFEKTALFAPFDSKYDRYLKGEVELTEQESLGESLFFSKQFTNCNRCHQLKAFAGSEGETFSNYEFHNLGVPMNKIVREWNGKGLTFVDHGLLENKQITDKSQDGKFKTPTLRNVAITAPYMHNGVFNDLKTVILFYDHFNNPKRDTNPETGKPWDVPEVDNVLALKDKEFKAPPLKDDEVEALVAFLKTLTDKRYESLAK